MASMGRPNSRSRRRRVKRHHPGAKRAAGRLLGAAAQRARTMPLKPSVQSPFDDPLLYDWEYRRRRDDVRFYRTLAGERGGPVLDLGCGTGRLMLPLLRDGHVVVGVDRAPPMLTRAAGRVARLRAELRRRALLVRGDLRALPLTQATVLLRGGGVPHVQHCESDAELLQFFRGAAAALVPGGWLAFDTFAPTRRFLERRGPSAPTRFRDPRSGRADALHREPRARRSGAGDDLSLSTGRPRRHGNASAGLFHCVTVCFNPAKSKHCWPAPGSSSSPVGAHSTDGRSTPTTSAASNTSIWHALSTPRRRARDDQGRPSETKTRQRRARRAAWARNKAENKGGEAIGVGNPP